MAQNTPNPTIWRHQASVFQNDTDHFTDPSNGRGYLWITVTLPEGMYRVPCTDEQIMRYVEEKIEFEEMMEVRTVIIGDSALHGQGRRCISLPVRRTGQSLQQAMTQGAVLASWWLTQIRYKRVKLDRFMIFEAKEGFLGDCRDVPLEWGKPGFAGPDKETR